MTGRPTRGKPKAGSGLDVTGAWVPAFPGQRAPLGPGHKATVRHSFYVSPLLRDADRTEVVEIMDSLRAVLPVHRESFDLLLELVACRLWRLRRGYQDLSANGMLRRGGKPAPILVDIGKLEGGLVRDLSELGLTPKSMVSLGLDLLKGEGMALTVTRLHALVAAEEKTKEEEE